MNACLATGLMRQFYRLFGVLVLSLFSYQMAVYAAPANVSKKTLRTTPSVAHADVGSKLALLNLRANPYALSANTGKQTVQFSVLVRLTRTSKTPVTVFLRRKGDKQNIEMNDLGKNGDYIANDGVHGASVQIDTSKIEPDTCLVYEAFTKGARAEFVSPALRLCVSSFPVRVATPNVDKPVVLPDGVKAVANEVLLYAKPTTSAATIRELARSINAGIVGSIIPLNLYQLKLPSPVSAKRLLEIIAQLNTRAEIAGAAVNALGQPAGHVDITTDPEFANQHGVKLVLKHSTLADNYVWDAGALGTGVTVVVADEGMDPTQLDFGISGDCQLSQVPVSGVAITDCGGTNNDNAVPGNLQWHGTRVAGVLAAKAYNTRGIAGVAHGSKIYSYKVASYAVADMDQIFTDMVPYVSAGASVINASFSGGPWSGAGYTLNVNALCAAVNTAVSSGSGAIAVIAAGNTPETSAGSGVLRNPDDWYYPARCNEHAAVLAANRSRIIAVGNSTSVVTPNCGSVDVDQRCAGAIPFNANLPGSNYGAWVDITAPGSDIRTTTSGGYATSTGTSFSTPIVSGAVAILKSCGVPLDSIKSTLIGSATMNVPYPAVGSLTTTPRLDVYRALSSVNHAPSGVGPASNTVNENNAAGAPVATLTATDPDPCDKFAFALVTGLGDTDNGAFTIAGNQLTINGVANCEAKPSYSIRVQVTDFGGLTASQSLTVSVGDADEFDVGAVTDSDAATADSVLENATNGTTVGLTASGSDADCTNNTITYSLIDNAGGRFAIDSNSGVVSVAGAIDREAAASYNITVRATSADTSFTDQAFSISLNDVDEFNVGAVTDSNVAANAVDENAGNGTLVGLTAAASDADATTNTITYSLTDDAGGRFAINPANGVVTVSNGTLLDRETAASHNITVRATSADASFTDQVFAITVNNVNEMPTGTPSITGIRNVTAPPPQLTADTTTYISNPDSWTITTYLWLRNNMPSAMGGTPVGANSPTYSLQDPGDVGKYIGLCVTFTTFLPHVPPDVTLCSGSDAVAVGDPHITTVDGLYYDFQAAGEFVVLRGSNGMEIQARQAPVSTAASFADSHSGLTVGPSINTAVAARVGNRRVTLQPNITANPAAAGLKLRIDGVQTTLPANGINLGSGGRIVPITSGAMQVDFPDGTTMVVTPGWWGLHSVWYLNINIYHTSAHEGIMGARTKDSWLPRLSNGTSLGVRPVALHDRYVDLYETFADSWRVNNDTSLFDYARGTSTKTFTFAQWPLEKPPYVIPQGGKAAKPIKREVAQQLCREVEDKNNKANCIFDVMVTGHAGFAKTYLLEQKIRAGLTAVVVRGKQGDDRPNEFVTFTATVVRHASGGEVVSDSKDTPIKAVATNIAPTGFIQFTLDGKSVGKPVRLNSKGQAMMKLSRVKVAGRQVGARYIPAKGSIFFPSSSFEGVRLVKEVK